MSTPAWCPTTLNGHCPAPGARGGANGQTPGRRSRPVMFDLSPRGRARDVEVVECGGHQPNAFALVAALVPNVEHVRATASRKSLTSSASRARVPGQSSEHVTRGPGWARNHRVRPGAGVSAESVFVSNSWGCSGAPGFAPGLSVGREDEFHDPQCPAHAADGGAIDRTRDAGNASSGDVLRSVPESAPRGVTQECLASRRPSGTRTLCVSTRSRFGNRCERVVDRVEVFEHSVRTIHRAVRLLSRCRSDPTSRWMPKALEVRI